MLRVGTTCWIPQGTGRAQALSLPEGNFFVRNPEPLMGYMNGVPFLASYDPQDQYCTVLLDTNLDATERVLDHYERIERTPNVYEDIRQARGRSPR